MRVRQRYPVNCLHKPWPKYFEASKASFHAIAPGVSGFQSWTFLRGEMPACALRATMASWHLRVSYAPSAVTLMISSSGGVWLNKSGNIGASPMLLFIASIVWISSVCSSTPICVLRQRWRFNPPYLRVFHSPSPSPLVQYCLSEGAAVPLLLDMEWQQTTSFNADTRYWSQVTANSARSVSTGFPQDLWLASTAHRTTLWLWSMLVWPHFYRLFEGPVYLKARHQTKAKVIRVASRPDWRLPNFWSRNPSASSCS